LEALHTLTELVTLYSKAFSAILQNPHFAWYYLDESLSITDISDVFDRFAAQADIDIGTAAPTTGVTTKVDPDESIEWSKLDALSISLLGMPQDVDADGTNFGA